MIPHHNLICSFKLRLQIFFTLFTLYCIFSLWGMSVENKIFTYISLFISFLIVIFALTQGIRSVSFFILFAAFFCLSSMALFSNKTGEPVAILINAYLFVFAMMISNIIYKLRLACRSSVILFSTTHIYFFIFCIYKYKIDGFINENTFNELFWQSSRNIVSAILLLTTIFFLAVNYIEQKKIYLSVLFINMISSILLYGRSGVVLSFIVLFIGIYLKFFKEEKNVIKIILFLFFSILILVLILYTGFTDNMVSAILSHTNLQSGFDTPRIQMWYDYIVNFDYKILLLGTNFLFSPLITSFDGNPHNSFIMFQARFGIFAVLFLLSISYLYLKLFQNSLLLSLLLGLIFVRMFFDTFYLFGYFDFIWVYMLIYLPRNNKKRSFL